MTTRDASPRCVAMHIRQVPIVERDGVEVGRQYHREVFHPGSDISAAPGEVQAIASALWTADVIAAYEASLETEEV